VNTRIVSLIGILTVIVSGCCTSNVSDSRYTRQSPKLQELASKPATRFPDRSAAALAFSAPITRNNPALDLYRDARGPQAFVGFEQTTTQYRWVRTDDRQSSGPWFGGYGHGGGFWHGDRFDRRAITVEETTRVR